MQILPRAADSKGGSPDPFIFRAAHESTDERRAIHATDLAGNCPEWVELVPAGSVTGVDGRGPYHNPDPELVVERSMEKVRAGMPIDVGHAIEEEGHVGAGAAAAGWITDLRVQNGAVHGKVDWTSLGKTQVGGKLYRFLSPVFYHDAKGVVGRLAGAALTNRPNLALKALNSQETGLSDKLKALMARLLAPFSMPETTDEDALVARVTAAAEAEKLATKIVTAFSLAKTATVADVEKALNSAVAAMKTVADLAKSVSLPITTSSEDLIKALNARTGTTDTTKFVPMEQYSALADSVKALQAKESEQVIGDAIKAGKIVPPLKDYYLAQHAKDPKGIAELIAKMPVVVPPGTDDKTKKAINAADVVLTDDQKSMCSRMGIKEDDFKKTLAAEAAAR